MIVDVPGLPVWCGGRIIYARVDPDDFLEVFAYRWFTDKRRGPRRYVARREQGQTVYLHRELMGLPRGERTIQVDHINGDTLDNRRANLRVVTQAQNVQNIRPRQMSRSRFRGVGWHRGVGKWQVRVTVEGRTIAGGYFEDEDEAGAVAAALRAKHMPFSREALAT